jgi:hypothetical protein
VLGTDYATIMARAPTVIANNLRGLSAGSPRVVAHMKIQARPASVHCTHEATVYNHELCMLAGTLYQEFITTPACNGSVRCAWAHTMVFEAKHTTDKQMNPGQLWWLWLQILRTSYWAAGEVQEFMHWCVDDASCQYTIGDGICALDNQCTNDMPPTMNYISLFENDDPAPYWEGLEEYEMQLETKADWLAGGGWGLMSEESTAGYAPPCDPEQNPGCN